MRGMRYPPEPRHAGNQRRHVLRREAQIAKGMRPKAEWRRVSISIRAGSPLDERLKGLPKGCVSEWVRFHLGNIDESANAYTALLSFADDRERAVLSLIQDVHDLRHAAGHHSEGEVDGCASCASMGGL